MERFVAWVAQIWMDLQNAVLAAVRFVLFPGRFPEDPRCIVVFRVGNIGDTITALPAMAAIRKRFPKSRIVFLTSPGRAGMPGAKSLLKGSGLFDEILYYTTEDISTSRGKRALLKRLRDDRPDAYIELTTALASFGVCLRNMLFAKMIHAKAYRAGQVSTPPFGRRPHSKYYIQPHDARRTMGIASSLLPDNPPYRFPIPVSPEAASNAQAVLHNLNDPVVAVCPGGKREINRWPANRFGEVAAHLADEFCVGVVVIGGPKDIPLYEEIRRACPKAASAIGLSLGETTEVLRRACLLVTNDTGPMHLAAAVGTPVVAIFSARDYPRKWYPFGKQHIILRKDISCAGCFLEKCSTMYCIRQIEIEEVLTSCKKILKAYDLRALNLSNHVEGL